MSKQEAKAPSLRSSETGKNIPDDEFGKEFLDSWKSISVSKDDPIDFNFSVGSKGNKAFDFGKLDMDFDLGSDFTNMKSFKLDIPDVDFEAPTKKAPKAKETCEASMSGTNKRKESLSFNFDFNGLDDFNFDSSLEKESGKIGNKHTNAELKETDLEDPQWHPAKKENGTKEAEHSELLDKKACIEKKATEMEITKQNEKDSEDSYRFNVPERTKLDEIAVANSNCFPDEDMKTSDEKDCKISGSSDTSACLKETCVLSESTTESSHDIRSDEADSLSLNSMPAAQDIPKSRPEEKRSSSAAHIDKGPKPALFELVFQATPTETHTHRGATNSNPSSYAPSYSNNDADRANKNPKQEADKPNEAKRIPTNTTTPFNKSGNDNASLTGSKVSSKSTSLLARTTEIPKLRGLVVESQKSKQLYSNISGLKITGVTETPKCHPLLSKSSEGKTNKLTRILHSDVKPVNTKDSTVVAPVKRKSFTADVASINPHKRLSTSLIRSFKNTIEPQNNGDNEVENARKTNERDSLDTCHGNVEEFVVVPYVAQYDNVKEAEAYAKGLDDLFESLKRKLNEAKDVMVRAVVGNNGLLMIDHPSLHYKIGLLHKLTKLSGH